MSGFVRIVAAGALAYVLAEAAGPSLVIALIVVMLEIQRQGAARAE